mgnify:CR=1 FL=1
MNNGQSLKCDHLSPKERNKLISYCCEMRPKLELLRGIHNTRYQQENGWVLPDKVTISSNERLPKLKLWRSSDTLKLEGGLPLKLVAMDTLLSIRPFTTSHLGPPDCKLCHFNYDLIKLYFIYYVCQFIVSGISHHIHFTCQSCVNNIWTH